MKSKMGWVTNLANAGWSPGDDDDLSSNIFTKKCAKNREGTLEKMKRRQEKKQAEEGNWRSY